MTTPLLATPITLRGLTIANRVWMSPMCQYAAPATGPDVGCPGPHHLTHYAARAQGGVGLIIVEATAICPSGRISAFDLGLWDDHQITAHAALVAAIHAAGAKACLQLGHAGRKAGTPPRWGSDRPTPQAPARVGPSPVPFSPTLGAPRALTPTEVTQLPQQFAAATRRALAAGYDSVEIHAAHGYLLQSFLSPLSNHRTDQWGGDFTGRTRVVLDTVDAVRAALPSQAPLLLRISATDWVHENDPATPAWTSADTVTLAPLLAARGVDLLDCSAGGATPTFPPSATSHDGYQRHLARAVAHTDTTPRLAVGAVGRLNSAVLAEDVLTSGDADVVLVGRKLLADPYLPHRWTAQLGGEPRWPAPYTGAIPAAWLD